MEAIDISLSSDRRQTELDMRLRVMVLDVSRLLRVSPLSLVQVEPETLEPETGYMRTDLQSGDIDPAGNIPEEGL